MSKEAIEYIEQLLADKLKATIERKLYGNGVVYIKRKGKFYIGHTKRGHYYLEGGISVGQAVKQVWSSIAGTKYENEIMAYMLSSVNK